MISTIWRRLFKLLPYQKIPKLPRGMLSAQYETLTHDERRVLARMGARDPRGVRVLLKRARVKTVDELALQHQQPDRNWRSRVYAVVCHWFNGTPYNPHRREIIAALRPAKSNIAEVKQRLERVTNARD